MDKTIINKWKALNLPHSLHWFPISKTYFVSQTALYLHYHSQHKHNDRGRYMHDLAECNQIILLSKQSNIIV